MKTPREYALSTLRDKTNSLNLTLTIDDVESAIATAMEDMREECARVASQWRYAIGTSSVASDIRAIKVKP